MEDLVTIIIPCYNAENYIDETIESIVAQTYKPIEIVCIDDGSTDGTLNKLYYWRNRRQVSIRIFEQKNGGVSKARNRGIEVSQGKYIIFCDSDDIIHQTFTEELVSGLKDGHDVAYCRLSRMRDEVMAANMLPIKSMRTQKEAMKDLLYNMGSFGFCCYIYNREILIQNNLIFEENTRYGEDREFNWKYLCHCYDALYINAPLYWYRTNETSATRRKMEWNKTDSLRAVERTYHYLQSKHVDYAEEYYSYMHSRVMWSVAKSFALSKRKDLFKRLGEEYDVRECMKRTLHDKNTLVRLASTFYLINPKLFYYSISIVKG